MLLWGVAINDVFYAWLGIACRDLAMMTTEVIQLNKYFYEQEMVFGALSSRPAL